MFIIILNCGRTFTTDIHAEARMYAFLSYEHCICNVYKAGTYASPLPLAPWEI